MRNGISTASLLILITVVLVAVLLVTKIPLLRKETPTKPRPTPGPPGQVEMVKPADRDLKKYANARCNNGAAFGFELVLAPSNSQNKDTWIVDLQGGGWCDDYSKPCSERKGPLSTGPTQKDGQFYESDKFKGILSGTESENPEFFDANRIFAYYCTSDNWSGFLTSTKKTQGGNFYFSGHHNVEALFNILKQSYGLDDKIPDTKVLFTGTSAGACGVAANAYNLRDNLLPKTANDGRLKLLLDACWLPEWDNSQYRIDRAKTSDLDVVNRMHTLWGSKLDPDCEKTYSNEKGKCFLFKYVYPFLTLPTLVQNSSRDSDIAVKGHSIPRNSPTLNEWKKLIISEFNLEPVKWIFSSDEIYHTISTAPTQQSGGGWCRRESSTGVKFCDMVSRFWNDDTSGVERAITP